MTSLRIFSVMGQPQAGLAVRSPRQADPRS
jgi:hypothetical protein